MDGTLTVAVHDFDAIRLELGLPAGKPILEALADLPEAVAKGLFERLDELELELARRARAAEGAAGLLDALAERSARLGIVTRNSHANSRRSTPAGSRATSTPRTSSAERRPYPNPIRTESTGCSAPGAPRRTKR